jgi:hypothetical protein
MAGILGNAARLGRTRRLKEAERGVVTWTPAHEEQEFIEKQNKAKYKEARNSVRGEAIEESIQGPFGEAGLQALRKAMADGLDAGGEGWGQFEGDADGPSGDGAMGMRGKAGSSEDRIREGPAASGASGRERELMQKAMDVAERMQEVKLDRETAAKSGPGLRPAERSEPQARGHVSEKLPPEQ